MNLLPSIKAQKQLQRRADIDRALIHHEAKIGGTLFGDIPVDNRREFFCLDERTWVWHEEWNDLQGQRRMMTTRYDVRPDGVLKSQGNQSYRKLTGQEAKNFYRATELYIRKMTAEYGRLLQAA